MRVRLDSIRIAENRPTVALVLSGGGAKGAAEVGVKKLMDELEIPVDLICGTSMGGLMGGLMALGYPCEYIDSLLRHQDWDITLSDKVGPRYIPYETKAYKSKYIISVPFHYQPESIRERILEQEKYSGNNGVLDLGAHKEDMNTKKGMNTLAGSLPSGYVYGLNVNNLLSSFTVGYQDSIAFRDLPIPFFCVATDLVSCKAKNWGSGSLKTAMRSTMSIPGMFDPVRTQGMILVDGGTRNNFPVDLARTMGADIVVGVELSDQQPTYFEVNNVGNIASQFITMLGKDAYDKNVSCCDIFIKPDLTGYNMLSFKPAAIDTMINRGRDAALAKIDEFMAVKELVGDAGPRLSARPAIDIANTPVQVGSIRFAGLSDRESKMLQEETGFNAGQMVTAKTINHAMSKIQATGCFESVTYSLLGKEAPYDLVFNCVKGPSHQLGFSLRADTEEWVALLFNLGLNTHRLMGSKFDFEFKLGTSQYLKAHYILDLPKCPTLNFEVMGAYTRADMTDPERSCNFSFLQHRESFYISNMKWTRLNLKLGLKNQFYSLPESWYLTSDGYQIPESLRKGTYGSFFAHGGVYTLYNKYYPLRGIDVSFHYEHTIAKKGVSHFLPTHALSFNWMHVFRIGERVALIPDFHLRMLVDKNADSMANSLAMNNYVGGEVAGRYFDHQIPMVGTKDLYFARDHAAVLNMSLRYSPVKNLFLSAKGGYFRDATTLPDLLSSLDPTFMSAALEIGYNTIIGPLRGELFWSSHTNSPGYYISLGFDF